jgi:hypothetical protein
MAKAVSSVNDILAALPAVQKAVSKEIRARIDAGEKIASMSDEEMQARSKAVFARTHSNKIPKKSAA